MTDPRPSTTT